MKIARLEIEGFRSLRKVIWEPGDLNVLIGPNGSGKSNLLRFLELMAVSAQGRLGKYIQSLGGMYPIVWDGVADSIKFSLDIIPDGNELGLNHYELELTRLGTGSSYKINRELLTGIDHFKFIERKSTSAVVRMNYKLLPNTENDTYTPFIISEESLDEEEAFLDQVAAYSGMDDDFYPYTDFRDSLASIAIYHDLRTDRDAAIRQPVITSFDNRVESDGRNLISVLHTLYTSDRDFKRDINAAMSAAFGDDYDELVFPPASDQRIQLRIRWKSLKREQSAADLSDGTLRFLFLLTVLAHPTPPDVIAIDEPETGLHPSMLSIIAEFAQEAAMRSQIILTTHSPQFLDAFTESTPTTTVAQIANGETILCTLPSDELEYWLKNYSMGALFRSGELELMA
ncbi:MAG: AAA family ATPase [Candidatus Methylumidiphilus sp.]